MKSNEQRVAIGDAKLTSKGQLYLPREVMEVLGLDRGDHVIFLKNSKNEILVTKGKVVIE